MSGRLAVIFVGGGTGGHLFPSLAVAEALAEQTGQRVDPLYLCSTREVDARILTAEGARYEPIPARPLRGSPIGALRFARSYRPAVRAAHDAMRAHTAGDATILVSTGGFVSVPCVRAASMLRLPAVLLNLDAVPGLANRLLARRAGVVLSVFDTSHQWRRIEPIVRRRALAPASPGACRSDLGLDADRPTLLVTGGSQGASTITTLVAGLLEQHPGAFAGWQAIHQCADSDAPRVRKAYERAGVRARIEPFIEDVGRAWGAASLAIGRAGAGTAAEARANAVPGVFLPYPWHKDEHQRHNAAPLERAGGALILTDHREEPANTTAHGATLLALLQDHERLARMRSALTLMPACDGAQAVARVLMDQIKPGGRRAGP
ncbi:MAG: glycosyltransferase [Planctomycetota bacterium]